MKADAIAEACYFLAPTLNLTAGEAADLALVWAAGPGGIASTRLGPSAQVNLVYVRDALGPLAGVSIDTHYADSKRIGARGTYVLRGGDQLQRLANDAPWRPPIGWKVRGHGERMATRLVHNWERHTDHDEFRDLLIAGGSRGVTVALVRATLFKVRRAMSAAGLVIEHATGGKGGRWRIAEPSRENHAEIRAAYLQHEAGRGQGVCTL